MTQSNHFDSIADVFNRIWYFSDAYKEFVTTHILEDLSLGSEDILADIGGGTGSFTSRLGYEASLLKAYCIEPSSAMCEEASKLENITPVCSDAHTFVTSNTPFTKMLFKEVIHHLPERGAFWKLLHPILPQGGKMLIITRPKNIAFPFFASAKEVFARHQPSQELIETELKEGGFEIITHLRSHTFTLAKEDWYTMLRHRFMSDLGVFSDEEIEAGIEEIESIYTEETIDIIDNLIFITATKK
ncbi:MAG: methyltransferase domain-containing protein [Sulfuricurvum sp.]|uniref:class I SAM-dependent methyltransferase n=1 Tax=Sulfuricurvum sp. TaxID=2025608 RepID=UPI0025CBE401|nr:class I SAM-dependent methyltransferase [Sulfuricurvum sp.]MBV5321269.1 methyltransferase domain-containing protein [Sulfuricurvum sp.]